MNTSSAFDSTPSALSPWVDSLFKGLDRIQRPGFLVGVVAQLLVLGGMILMQLVPHLSGTTVWLKVVPVDPRDMFRGEYVILSYEMSRPSSGSWLDYHPDGPTVGSAVYVLIEPDDDSIHHRAVRYFSEPPASGLYIKGIRKTDSRIEYGIESFYVQSGTGHDYEDAARNGTLSAEVAIGGDGQAGLKGLRVLGRTP